MNNIENTNHTKKFQIWMPLLLAMAVVGGMMIGLKLQTNTPSIVLKPKEEGTGNLLAQGKIEELIRYIEAKYVDEVDRDKLIEKAINSIIKELDPHSNYISAEQLQNVNEQLEGNFDGIGIEFLTLEDTVVVVTPLVGGPSELVGIMSGDKIIKIEDTLVAGTELETQRIMDKLRGEKGTKVNISILRGKEDQLRTFTITRDKIPVHSVDVAYMIDPTTGYIKINRFSATTYEEFMKELEVMVEKNGMKNLVIDVRQNPGGYLQQATNILSQLFEEKNQLLVYTEGRTVNRSDYESTGRSFFEVKNITVLIDEGSASASEILAGAIQDHDRGTIIGRRSFGKGLVQEQYNLKDGAALRLTVARYYTPSGRSIQKAYDDLEDYDHDMIDRYASGELLDENKIIIADSTEYYTSHGRVVYGGGGVKPDIFIPIDTTLMDDYYLELRQHVAPFVFKHLEKHKDDYKDYTLERFKRKFYVNTGLFNDFMDYAYSKEVEKDMDKLANIQSEMKRFLKARIAKHLFDDEGFYSVWLEDDVVVQKALEVLKEDKPITELKH